MSVQILDSAAEACLGKNRENTDLEEGQELLR